MQTNTMKTNSTNPELELAFDYVQYTNQNIFLTGKAGTGKTTFLHRVKQESIKRAVVVAPTGVAAINAQGMTIHSFFQLPFGMYLPNTKSDPSRQRKFSGRKIDLIRSLDLLIIDEISMVRADLLDSVDEVLRRYRDFTKPFGGVQLLMIGDLHQLPPVVKQDEWNILQEHYKTPYFFGSHALQKTNPIIIQLKHIYRQSDEKFIRLLNKVRDNQLDSEVMNILNTRYIANFQPPKETSYITLTSHNAAAQAINEEKLAMLPGMAHRFTAKIEGEFPAHAYPTDEVLEFKEGAQVLFTKNDTSVEKEYYNGKIGQIIRIEEDGIVVKCPPETNSIYVSPVEWHNIKYSLDENSKEVKEEVVGTFTQYPLKLAWAITIHKSQGLTFERAIIDAQAAFAHGQVYVALSRCKSLEGIVLHSKIGYSSVKTDSVVKDYSKEADRYAPNENHLQQSKRVYLQTLIQELFDFTSVKKATEAVRRIYLEQESTLSTAALQQFNGWAARAETQVFAIAEKFRPQLQFYFNQPEALEENQALQERIKKGSIYFLEKLQQEFLPELKKIPVLTDNQAVKKSASDKLKQLGKELFVKNSCFVACQNAFTAQTYIKAKVDADLDFEKSAQQLPVSSSKIPKTTPHPDLYLRLYDWREELATELNIQPYEIVAARTIIDLTQFLPTDMAALKKIKGIGKMKSQRFGAALINIIENYCSENGITTTSLPIPTSSTASYTKSLSFNLFNAGKSLDEIAAERGLTRSTIESHLGHFVALGDLDIFSLLNRSAVEEIEEFFITRRSTSTSEAKAHFGDRYSYGELRLVAMYLKSKEIMN